MINYTTCAANTQNCYVDLTNPYNPYPATGPYITWQPPLTTVAYPQTAITTTDSTTSKPDEEQHSDLADMIRDIVRDELSRLQHTEKSAKGIARDVLKLLKDELRMQGAVTRL